ncbi:MAG: hypothetical protein SPK90_01050 [Bacteroidales bacterium]|jgi:hypothetical protein|nr:hypothetical protein [Bacteroidales bacterium]
MKREKHELCEADKTLFAQMEGCYLSENERIFFENLKHKEEFVISSGWDVLLSPNANNEQILFYRDSYDWYMIERKDKDHYYIEEFYGLANVLVAPASKWDLGDGTILDWLRRRDYTGVRYDDYEE